MREAAKHTTTAVLLVAMLVVANSSRAAAAKEAAAKPKVEVVFVLDTTGSMGGLINAAKEKIWAIANNLANTKPAPEIKMGLIGFRDRGDAYVTKRVDLTDDLDAVYGTLMGFQAGGGGDGPESVNQALNEAITKLTWSRDKTTYRVVYLVGDSPPHMDYKDDVKYPESCKLAAAAGIIVNAIQCGSQGGATPFWQQIAAKSEGSYFRVEQSGGAILAKTPFDKEIAKLSRELDGTRVYYGKKEVRAKQAAKVGREDKIYKEATPASVARRATFNASKAGEDNFAGTQELVDQVEKGQVKLEEVAAEELPVAMQKMSIAERRQHVAQNAQRRRELQAQINGLAAKRNAHIEAELKAAKVNVADSFDAAVYSAIRKQAAKKGIEYGEAMSH